jgi:iron-sulfur cluster assembly accessory protein
MVIERDGARVLVDQSSLTLLGGAQLDYTDALMGAHFAIKNPNATSACGCGSSFSID